MIRLFPILCGGLFSLAAVCADAEPRGDAAAVAAAEKLLAAVGGRDAWATARTFSVEERVYLSSGEVAQLLVSRDLVSGARRIERRSPGGSLYREWIAADKGWEERDGVKTPLDEAGLAAERFGLRQEPYAIYRRLALRDPGLRFELRDPRSLYVYDHDERLLCWFLLDGKGAALSWANFYEGSVNQHYYGPLADVGDVNLPKWGVSANGSFRFEYVKASMLREALVEPAE